MTLSEAIQHVPAHPSCSARRTNIFGGYDSVFNEGNGQLHAYRTRQFPSAPAMQEYLFVTDEISAVGEVETFYACNGGDCDQRDWYVF
jgi:hypothetical protein